jgi:hypothetical protein
MLSAAIDSVAICHITTRDLFDEDLQNYSSDFIDPSKLLLASSLSPLPIGELAEQTKASTANQFSSHDGDSTPSQGVNTTPQKSPAPSLQYPSSCTENQFPSAATNSSIQSVETLQQSPSSQPYNFTDNQKGEKEQSLS